MIRRPIQPAARWGLGALSLAVLLTGYTWLSHRQHRINPKDTTIPTWTQMAQGISGAMEARGAHSERWLVDDAMATGWRYLLGMTLGVAGGVILGILMGCFAPFEAFAYPLVSLLSKIPPTAALAVFFVMVGTDTEMYVAMIAFGIMPTLTMANYLAVREFPDELLFKAYTLGADNVEVILNIIFRQVLPRILDGVRLMIGPAMVFLIAAELLVADVGFGYRIRLQSKLLNMSVVYPYLALLAAFGFTADYALRRLQSRLCPWCQPKSA